MLADILNLPPYSLDSAQKEETLFPLLNDLVRHHYERCPQYAAIMDKVWKDKKWDRIEELPYLPVRLFKQYEMKSVAGSEVSRAVTSSGTSGQAVSRVFLDKETSFNQVRALSSIIGSFIGKKRLPLLILDTSNIIKDPRLFPVRGAGLMSFSMFGRNAAYALDENMNLNWPVLEKFFSDFANEPTLMTGYTYMIWEYVIRRLEEEKRGFNFSKAWLFHGGGWKKLKDKAVGREEFARRCSAVLGNVESINYYGMAEQLGSIYTECAYGHMHCSIFSDIIVRNPFDFSTQPDGEKGLLQTLSILPKSYPGFSILTEDEGVILGRDDCPCGKKGKYFKIHGRIKNAELRGCGDTHERA